jgi:hypothetical protein
VPIPIRLRKVHQGHEIGRVAPEDPALDVALSLTFDNTAAKKSDENREYPCRITIAMQHP